MKTNPISLLIPQLNKLKIEYEYFKHDPSLVIEFAEKKHG